MNMMVKSSLRHRPPRAHALSTTCAVLVALLGALSLVSCSGAAAADDLPETIGADQTLLFRHASDHLVLFDTTQQTIAVETTRPQLFHYDFPTRENLFTSGDSTDNGFRILRVDGPQITTVLLADSNQGVFPLASDGSTFLFTVVDYTEADGAIVQSRVARLEGEQLVEYANIDGAVTAGVLLDSTLFYSVFQPESELYDLLRVDVSDLQAIPEVLDSGLTEGDVYSYQGVLIADDFYSPTGATLNCDYYCYIDEVHGLVLALYPNDSQDLSLDAIDLASGERRWSEAGDLVDFTIDGDQLTIYAVGAAPKVMDLAKVDQ